MTFVLRYPIKIEDLNPYMLSQNPNINQECLDYVLKFPKIDVMSSNPSDLVVDVLLNTPDLIDYVELAKNTNSRAVKHCLKYVQKNSDNFHGFLKLLKNPNDLATDYCLSLKKIKNMLNNRNLPRRNQYAIALAENTNDKAVQFTIKLLLNSEHDPYQHIICSIFIRNPNDIAVDFILNHIEMFQELLNPTFGFDLSHNENGRIVNYLLKHPNFIDKNVIIQNSHPALTSLIRSIISNKFDARYLYYNKNPLILDWLNHITSISSHNFYALISYNPALFRNIKDRIVGLYLSVDDTLHKNNIMYKIPPDISRYLIDSFL